MTPKKQLWKWIIRAVFAAAAVPLMLVFALRICTNRMNAAVSAISARNTTRGSALLSGGDPQPWVKARTLDPVTSIEPLTQISFLTTSIGEAMAVFLDSAAVSENNHDPIDESLLRDLDLTRDALQDQLYESINQNARVLGMPVRHIDNSSISPSTSPSRPADLRFSR